MLVSSVHSCMLFHLLLLTPDVHAVVMIICVLLEMERYVDMHVTDSVCGLLQNGNNCCINFALHFKQKQREFRTCIFIEYVFSFITIIVIITLCDL
jgi:hypothetical protein